MEEINKANPHHDSRGRFASGGGGGGALTPGNGKRSQALNQVAIDLFNHKQSMPMSVRTGKKTPEALAWRQKFSEIVDQGAKILGVSPREAHNELQRRMGVGS